MASLFDEVTFQHGTATKNRFTLAPLTNQQSHVDGTLSDDEYRWLTMRAQGGFGLTMTCASHVLAIGQGFPGQLGCYSDDHLPGLTRLAAGINATGSLSIVQLHHAGRRSPVELIGGQPVSSFDDESTGARGLTTDEVTELVAAFVSAAKRCEQAGFDGVQVHGAHDYIICQFLNGELNQRTDQYGGSLENRARVIFEILRGIRETCRPNFNVSVRLSPEMFGMKTKEIIELYGMLVDSKLLDFIDLSLWNAFMASNDPDYPGQILVNLFGGLERGDTRLVVAGKIYTADEAQQCLDAGADMVALGRAAITNHDFPNQCRENPNFAMRELPVSRATLDAEGLGETFITYMSGWRGFVEEA